MSKEKSARELFAEHYATLIYNGGGVGKQYLSGKHFGSIIASANAAKAEEEALVPDPIRSVHVKNAADAIKKLSTQPLDPRERRQVARDAVTARAKAVDKADRTPRIPNAVKNRRDQAQTGRARDPNTGRFLKR